MTRFHKERLRAFVILNRATWAILAVGVLTGGDTDAHASVTETTLAENAFKTADKHRKGYLDGKSLSDARRIIRGALKSSVRGNIPGGEKTVDGVVRLASQGDPDADKDGKVTLDEFTAFVSGLMKTRDDILQKAAKKAAQERQAMLKAYQRYYKAWLQQLQRELARNHSQGAAQKRRR